MASERQINANRENAAKSTGPVTIKGKLRSSQNSLRHGLLARTVVLTGESLERFILLLDTLRAEFNPQTSVEAALVENMAVARWRQMRLWSIERAGIAREIQKQALADPDFAAHDDATRAAIAFRLLSDQSRSLDLMNRYEVRYERQYSRALDQLLRLRAKRDFAKRTQFPGSSETVELA